MPAEKGSGRAWAAMWCWTSLEDACWCCHWSRCRDDARRRLVQEEEVGASTVHSCKQQLQRGGVHCHPCHL